jgi:hypothetical protein
MTEQETTPNQAKPDEKSSSEPQQIASQPKSDRTDKDEPAQVKQQTTTQQQPPSKFSIAWKWLKRKADEANLADYLIVLLTAVIGFWAGLQWWEMHDAGKQTDKIIAADERLAAANERFAKSMENSVKQSGDSLQASIDQFHLDQRAWINIQFPQWEIMPNKPLVAHSIIVNSGKTPAEHISGKIVVRKVNDSEPFRLTYEGYPPSEPKTGILIPNSPITGLGYMTLHFAPNSHAIVPSNLSDTDVKEIQEGRAFGVVYGTIDYNDVFSEHHWIKFCAFYSGDMHRVQPFVVPCASYNDVDKKK